MLRAKRPAAPPPPDLLTQLATHGVSLAETDPSDEVDSVDPRERRQQMEAVLRDVLAEDDGGFRPPASLYQDFLVRCRIAGFGRDAMDMKSFRRALASARSGISVEAAESAEWQEAEAIASTLPEDMQGVFLYLARAALEQAVCPSDTTVAKVYGTHSTGRARRILGWLEEQNVIVLRLDGAGRRRAAIIGLGWETLPGDPGL